jgi:membrane protease YdiL (CAAX protease family)
MFVGGFGLRFIVSATAMSTFFVLTRTVSGSLWFAIGAHAAWDWAQTFLVGLGAVNDHAQDHALFRVDQHGPSWAVGDAPSIEGGGLFILLFLIASGGACAYAFRKARPWGDPLD